MRFFWIHLSLSSFHQRSQRIPTNRSAGRHTGLGVTRSSALPRGCEGTVSCRTCLILKSRNLRRRSEHLNHPAEPSQLCLCFYDLASFFTMSMKTGQHQNLFQSCWRQPCVDLKLFKILQVGFCSHSVGVFYYFFHRSKTGHRRSQKSPLYIDWAWG